MEAEIIIKPIGTIHSPYIENENIPIQGKFRPEVEAFAEIKSEYVKGLKDLDEFSHAILIYYFHKSRSEKTEGKPFLEDTPHGIFAIRSPNRPNHLGLSVVKISKISGNRLYFTEVEMLDGTPLIDIKPYVKEFDHRKDAVSGWIEKHFRDGSIPDRLIH